MRSVDLYGCEHAAGPLPGGGVAGGLTRFVGRQQELEALQQALAQAGVGHGQVVAVVGEAGVG